jgi:hypothetical protein
MVEWNDKSHYMSQILLLNKYINAFEPKVSNLLQNF